MDAWLDCTQFPSACNTASPLELELREHEIILVNVGSHDEVY
jgi:hypothetical protein